MPWAAAEGSLALAMLLAGLASGVHCLGMCGGIVGAFASGPIALHPASAPSRPEWARQFAFNFGRISSYAAAGAAVGALGEAAGYLAGAVQAQTALYALANLMLVGIGLSLAGVTGLLAPLENLGRPLWRRVQPVAVRLLAVRSLAGAFGAGAAWGWLPCGLVYAALAGAAFAGSAAGGALAMAAFGAGTLPNMLLAGLAAARLRRWMARPAVRIAAGGLVLGFGLIGLARLGGLAAGLHGGLHAG